jgi:hypothetical protein
MAIKKTDNDFIEDLTNPISDIMQKTQYEVLAVITNRIKKVGKMTASDAQRLSQLVRLEDLSEIENILSASTNLTVKQIDVIINDMALYNDNLAENLYKARNIPKSDFRSDASLLNIIEQARESIKDGVVNLSATTGFMVNGKMTSLSNPYNYAVNKAVFEVQQGLFDYNTVVRNTIIQLASGGIRTVDYQSGYHRRLDSSVMMNVSDGIRQMNVSYRNKQGEQFGADGIELSAHALSEPIHAKHQGKQFSKKEFEKLQSTLERPFFVMNCKHSSFPIILGISKPVHSAKELQENIHNSAKEVKFTTLKKDFDGNYAKNTLTKYEGSQKQREV